MIELYGVRGLCIRRSGAHRLVRSGPGATSLHARGIVCGVRKEPPRRPRRPLRASHSTRARQAVVVERQAGAGTALERHE